MQADERDLWIAHPGVVRPKYCRAERLAPLQAEALFEAEGHMVTETGWYRVRCNYAPERIMAFRAFLFYKMYPKEDPHYETWISKIHSL